MVSPEQRFRRVEALFAEALERSEGERDAYLLEACADDLALRREVETLLAADRASRDWVGGAVGAAASELLEVGRAFAAGARIGKYEILEPIGAGGFGVVYRGRDPILRRFVAIKTCSSRDAKLRQRFLREAQIAAGLHHPNIVTVYDSGIENGVPYLVQEFLDGEDLTGPVGRQDAGTIARRVEVLLETARGLEHAHLGGVVHRDIKPANLRILASGAVKILDFGIAKLLHERSELTSQGVTLGTVGYLAPEQLRGEPVTPRADIFAFGVVAYELLTYQRPFAGTTFSEVSYRLLTEPACPLRSLAPAVPAELARLVERCLAKDPADRDSDFGPISDRLVTIAARLGTGTGVGRERPGEETDSADAIERIATPRPAGSGDFLPTSAPTVDRRLAPRGLPRRLAWATGLLAAVIAVAWLSTRAPTSVDRSGAEASAASRGFEPASPSSPPASGPALEPQLRPPVPGPPATAADALSAMLDSGPGSTSESAPPSGLRVRNSESPPSDRAASSPRDTTSVASATPAGPKPAAAWPEQRVGPGVPVAQVASAESVPALPPPASDERRGEANVAQTVVEEAVRPFREGDLIRQGDPGVIAPRLVHRPAANYPDRARRRGITARVVLGVLVDPRGRVSQTTVLRSDDPGLGFNEAAVAAARQALYQPATRDGIAGKMWAELVIDFARQ